MIDKTVKNVEEALSDIPDGAVLMLGGFGLNGLPENSILTLEKLGLKNLTCISNNAGIDDFGIGILLHKKQVKKMISSYVGENKEFERQLLCNELEVELLPQGTLAEKIRAGGAGIPAFYVPAGVGTEVAEGKEVREFNGKKYLLETALKADFALVKAWKGDKAGNLIFKGTTRNFNEIMPAAANICIAEVEELVEIGEIDPNDVHVPGIFVHRIFKGENYEKRIEHLTVFEEAKSDSTYFKYGIGLTKEGIAKRIAAELKNNTYVNLGIGIPTLVANYIPDDLNIVLHSENGIIGTGKFPLFDEIDPDTINAGKQTVTLKKGAAIFNSAESFAMVRGHHIDLTVLGAMEVSENGEIANWKIPGKLLKGMGGAMDLVASAENIIVAMQHVSKDGNSKLKQACTLPLTGIACVKKIVTELAVIDILETGGFKLIERAPGVSIETIKVATSGKLMVESDVPEMKFEISI